MSLPVVEECGSCRNYGLWEIADAYVTRYSYRSRAMSLPVVEEASDDGAPEVSVLESIVPGLDFANHSHSANCRWEVASSSQVQYFCSRVGGFCSRGRLPVADTRRHGHGVKLKPRAPAPN